LKDVIYFFLEKNKINQRLAFKEDEKIDDRPPPTVIDVRPYTNSTLKISFSEPVKFLTDDYQMINYLLRDQILQVSI
jgi:hypothetical protein